MLINADIKNVYVYMIGCVYGGLIDYLPLLCMFRNFKLSIFLKAV